MPGQASFHEAIHGGFLDARRGMHSANEDVEMLKMILESRHIAMNEAKFRYNDLLVPVRRRRATSSQFSAFKTAKATLRERQGLLDDSKAQLEAAQSTYSAACQRFVQAKFCCGRFGCPGSHDMRQEAPLGFGNGQERTSGESKTWSQPTAQSAATAKPTAPTRTIADLATYEE
jgi:hypothetical protein